MIAKIMDFDDHWLFEANSIRVEYNQPAYEEGRDVIRLILHSKTEFEDTSEGPEPKGKIHILTFEMSHEGYLRIGTNCPVYIMSNSGKTIDHINLPS